MHPNRHYRQTENKLNIAFIEERGFGVLMVNGETYPLTASVPTLISGDGQELEFHLVKTNPIVKRLEQASSAVFLFNGPDGYISPDWYNAEDQVPTWNYVAIRLEGKVTRLPDDDLLPLLDRLSEHFEKRLLPKPIWKTSKVSDAALKKMLVAIAPFRFSISKMDSTWKLNQTKPDAVRLAAAEQVKTSCIGMSSEELSVYMQQLPFKAGS